MKNLLTIAILGLLCKQLQANPIDVNKARAIATSLLGKSNISLSSPARAKGMNAAAEAAPYYIYNADDNEGFTIVSGDDEFPEVVGYSHSGMLREDNLPPALTEFLQQYADYVNAVQAGEALAPELLLANNYFPEEVSPMLTCQWGQSAPYNSLCPDGSAVGCVATAMAQLMYYYKWPEKGTGAGSTTYNGSTLSVVFSNSTYDWSSMKEQTSQNKADEAAAAAVARVSYDCGVAAKMSYGASSGTSTAYAVKAFYNNFGYTASSIRHVTRDCYATQDEWMNLVKEELSNGRPLFYEAVSPTGGGSDAAGHAFVIDGYNSDNLVHVNWGWDGSSDGYYNIVTLSPSKTSYSFSSDQGMIIGLAPCKDGESGAFAFHPYMNGGISTTSTSVAVGSETFQVAYPNYYNMSATSAKWSASMGIFDVNGSFVANASTTSKFATYDYLYGVSAGSFNCKIPSTVADGEYALKLCFKSSGKYLEPDVVGGQEQNYIHLIVSNGTATLDKEPITTGIRSLPVGENVSKDTYNINGQRVAEWYKGIVIKNGKKIGVK